MSMTAIDSPARPHLRSPRRVRVRLTLTTVTGAVCAALFLAGVGLTAVAILQRSGDLSPLVICALYWYMVIGFVFPKRMDS